MSRGGCTLQGWLKWRLLEGFSHKNPLLFRLVFLKLIIVYNIQIHSLEIKTKMNLIKIIQTKTGRCQRAFFYQVQCYQTRIFWTLLYLHYWYIDSVNNKNPEVQPLCTLCNLVCWYPARLEKEVHYLLSM